MSHQAVAEAHERPHPTGFVYVMLAVFLAVITSIEVAVYYIHALRPALAPILIVLSATKFATVAAFYMHLRFDGKLFTYIFGGGLLLAACLVTAIMLLLQFSPTYTRPASPAAAEQTQTTTTGGQSGGG